MVSLKYEWIACSWRIPGRQLSPPGTSGGRPSGFGAARSGVLIEERRSVDAYCLKCREKREMLNPQPYKMKNGKDATTGTCPECGTKMFKIGKTVTAA